MVRFYTVTRKLSVSLYTIAPLHGVWSEVKTGATILKKMRLIAEELGEVRRPTSSELESIIPLASLVIINRCIYPKVDYIKFT
jgi:hypothetical protein